MESSEFVILVLTGSLFAPAITALINQPRFSRWLRILISVLISIVVALVTIMGTNGFTGNWYQDVILVITVSTFAYETLWKPTGVAPMIENATSPLPNTP